MANAMREAADRAAARNASTSERWSADAATLSWPDRTILAVRGSYAIVLRGRVHLVTSEHGDPRILAMQRVLALQIAGGAGRVVVISEEQGRFLVRAGLVGRELTFRELQALVAGDDVNPNALRFTLTGRRDSMQERARRAQANQASTSQRGGVEGLGDLGNAMRRAADRARANQNSTNNRGDSEELTEGRVVSVQGELGVYHYNAIRPILTDDIMRSRPDEAAWRREAAVARANQTRGILEISLAEARTAGVGAVLSVGEIQQLLGGETLMRWRANRAQARNASTGERERQSFTIAPRAVPFLNAARQAAARAVAAANLARKHAQEAKGKVAQARRGDAATLVGESVRLRRESFVAGDEALRHQGVATQLLAATDLRNQASEMRDLAARRGFDVGRAQSLTSRAQILEHKATLLERASEALQNTAPARVPPELDAAGAARSAGRVNARLSEARTRGLERTVTLEGFDVFSGLPFAGVHGNSALGRTLQACECGAHGGVVQGLAALDDQFNSVMAELAGEHASQRVAMGGISSVQAIGALSATLGIGIDDKVRAAVQAQKQKAMERAASGAVAPPPPPAKGGFGINNAALRAKQAAARAKAQAAAASARPSGGPVTTKKAAPPPPIRNKAGEYQGSGADPSVYTGPGADPFGPSAPADAPYSDPGAPAAAGGSIPWIPIAGGLAVLGAAAAFLATRKKAA